MNPGQFKQEGCDETSGTSPSTIGTSITSNGTSPAVIAHNIKPDEQNVYIFGKMGINTSQPEEALSVVGNVKVTGNILQPSDVRIKENIEPVDANQALENVSKLKLFKYDYKPEFVDVNGGVLSDYGVLAQDVQKIIPDAVVESGDLVLSNGKVVESFLHVNKVCQLFKISITSYKNKIHDKVFSYCAIKKTFFKPSDKKTSVKEQIV